VKIPLIGVTTWRRLSPSGYPLVTLVEAYVQALAHAGACPVLIPSAAPEDYVESLLPRLDGILFSGGGDVHPGRYGGNTHPQVKEIDEERDRLEIYLVKAARDQEIPFLGICRGIQVVNVALGGSLYEDVRDQHPNSLEHACGQTHPRDYLAHVVELLGGCRLAEIVGGTDLKVNSLHHQGVRVLAPSLQATGQAPDGLIEALELPDHPFALAVQWHPEWLQGQLAMRKLFEAFVDAARGRSKHGR